MNPHKPRILFINQYFPPDPAPTGLLLNEIANDLRPRGFQCRFVSTTQDYHAQDRQQRRSIRELRALVSILIQGVTAPKADLIVSGSSPPCLAAVAALIAKVHRAPMIHWAMDLYPELAVALGEIKPGFLSWILLKIMTWAYRSAHAVAALDEDMAIRFAGYGVSSVKIRPWVPLPIGAHASPAPFPPDPVHPINEPVWIYSGNLGRAHEWRPLLEAQAILEKRGSAMRLVFQGGGAGWREAQECADNLGLKQIEWNNYVPQEQLRTSLLRARALVATQKPETQGLLWPSKLALLMELPRPILWVGPKGAISQMLQQFPSAGIFQPDEPAGIANWLDSLPAATKSTEPKVNASSYREGALDQWRTLIQETVASSRK